MALDNMNGGGLGGLHSKQVGRITIFFDGISKTEIFRIDLDTKMVSFQGLTVEEATPGIDHLQFDLEHPNLDPQEGRMHWNADDGTLDFGLPGGSVNLQVGQENVLRAKNVSGDVLLNGTPVSIVSATGSRPEIDKTDITDVTSFQHAAGLCTEDIASNQSGFVTTFGLVRDVNTDPGTWSVSDVVYAGTTPGTITPTKPTAPNGALGLGLVIRAHATEGVIMSKVFQIVYLSSLSDVHLTGVPTNGQYLAWNTSNSRWEIAGP